MKRTLTITMMNKFLCTAALLMVAFSASAQRTVLRETTLEENENGWVETTVTTDKFKVETNHFFDNCFVSFGVGAQFYMGDNEKFMKMKDLITPAIDFSIGKWFTPAAGLQVSYSGYKINGLSADNYLGAHWMTNKEYVPKSNYKGTASLYEQEANFFNIHAEGLLNLNNLFGGYKERFYSITAYAGAGWIHSYNSDSPERDVDYITFNAGLINTFRLGKALDLNVTLRGAVVNDRFDGEVSGTDYSVPGGQNVWFDGYGGATIGLTYKFKQRGWEKAKGVTTVQNSDKLIARLNNRIGELNAENDNLKKAVVVPVVVKDKDNKVVTFPYLVNFVIDKVKVVNRERVNLGFVAEMMKSMPDKKFLLSGYADKYTGTANRNVWLAENRAKNVCEVLVKEFGVPADQLVVGSHGGVDNMFYNDPQLSRSVVITEYKK